MTAHEQNMEIPDACFRFRPTLHTVQLPINAMLQTVFLSVSDYINCIALLCLNKYACMYVD